MNTEEKRTKRQSERTEAPIRSVKPLDLAMPEAVSSLNFLAPESSKFPILSLAMVRIHTNIAICTLHLAHHLHK